MPSYEITVRVSGLVCFHVEADDEDEALQFASETWEMNVSDIQCCDADSIEVVRERDREACDTGGARETSEDE